MLNQMNEYSVLDAGSVSGYDPDCLVLSDAELGLVLGGNASDVTGAESSQQGGQATFDNSGSFRDGANQMAAAVGGVIAAGIGLTTAGLTLPVALIGALAAAVVGGVAAADAQIDMMNAKPD